MTDNILSNYLQSISAKFRYEQTSEMGYRADFEILLKELFQDIPNSKIFHDARTIDGNKPDFIVSKGDIPILYLEAKDIGVSLEKIEKSDQMSRYFGYANLILTDYTEFRFYRNGLPYGEPIKIAQYDKKDRELTPISENFEYLAHTILDFTQSHKEPIKSGKHLSKIMGGKAQRIRDNVRHFLSNNSDKNTELTKIYETIKKLLVHDLSSDSFADMYAQTLVYGLFVARFYDQSPENFTRQEARDLIPDSNPFLRQFFNHIVGPDFDKRLEYIVDELCAVFSHSDVERLMNQYLENNLKGKANKRQDTVIHFYEDFLNEYDSVLRKKMGAYYTPLPVVDFIIRSVDELLKRDFGLTAGLADISKLSNGKHKVQVLDPAVGTGTFISAVIDRIYSYFGGQKGRWPAYVQNDLLDRIHGFELMMAPYTIAHLKIGLALKDTGFYHFNNRRLGIYLTNSLEDSNIQYDLFSSFGLAESISEESKAAGIIKNKTPIMVVIGNPPYSGESSNAQYTGNDVYKIEPTGGKLQEKNSKWLNDDYVKFIRMAESMIENTGEGIVAMITPHGYIDNPTFRGMRWHLMKSFEKIYVFDLHGNTNKKEKSPDGSEDKNVFDIKTGVSILFGIKRRDAKYDLAQIYHADLYGKRAIKFGFLNDNQIDSVDWKQVIPVGPNYEWVARNEEIRADYLKGFSVNELFKISSVGIVTARDAFVIDMNSSVLEKRLQDFLYSQSAQEAKLKFNLRENRKWKMVNVFRHEIDESKFVKVSYRPFDNRYIYYNEDFIERSRKEVMENFLFGENIGLDICRQVISDEFSHIFLATHIVDDSYVSNKSKERGYVFPLYLYDNGSRSSNFDLTNLKALMKNVTISYEPENIMDYIYSVLYSPRYREKYKEFLKIDFPRVPYPEDNESFLKLVALGGELRRLHLLKSPKVSSYVTTYPESGSDSVEKVDYQGGNVYINEIQYFGNVPDVAWNFYIGGYQPAQKWLKDRKGRILTNEDIEHYQQMIVALNETDKIMKKIDEVMPF